MKRLKLFLLLFGLLFVFFAAENAQAYSLTVNGWANSGCNATNSNTVSVTEDRSFYLTNVWIGGNAVWDDQIGFSGTHNSTVVVDETAGWATGCDPNAVAGSGYVGQYFLSISGSSDSDVFQFDIGAWQKRDEISVGNTFHGTVEYGYTQTNCLSGQFTQSNGCVAVGGSISATPTSCTAPCSPNITWSTTGIGGKVTKNGVDWNANASGTNVPDAGLAADTYTYRLFAKDGFGNFYEVNSAVVTVSGPPPSCTATPSSILTNQDTTLEASGGNGSYSWSSPGGNFSSTTGQTTTVNFGSQGSKTVTVTSGGVGGTCTVTVSNAPAQSATISLSPATFSFSALQGNSPPSQTLTISNTGGSTLNWSGSVNTSSGGAWLSLSGSSGSVNPGQGMAIFVNISSSSLGVGTYNGTITISDPLASNSPQTASVSLTISSSGSPVSCTPSSATIITGQNVSVSAFGGTGSYSWSVSPSAGASLSSTSGSTINASFTTTGTKTFTVTSGASSNTCSVDVQTAGLAAISLSPASFSFSAPQGSNPGNQTLNIENVGSATLNWSGTKAQSWLTLSPSSGSLAPGANQNVTLSVASAALAIGSYTDTITVSDGAASNSPQTASVSLNVTGSGTAADFSFYDVVWTIPSGTPRYRVDYDYNDDGVLNQADRAPMPTWTAPGPPDCPPTKNCDVNGSGTFNIGDYLAYGIYLRTLDVYSGQSGSGTVYLTSSSGGTVNLTSNGPTGSGFTPSSVNVPSGGSAQGTSVYTVPTPSAGNYSITITGQGSGAPQSFGTPLTLNVTTPSVDLKVNGLDGPISEVYGSTVNLSWTSSFVSSCTASASPSAVDWSGVKGTSGNNNFVAVNAASRTYTLTCGTASDSVVVNTLPPSAFQQFAPSTSCIGTAPRINLSWENLGDRDTLDVYRTTNLANPYTKINSSALPNGTTSYADSAVSPGTIYYYKILATNPGGSTWSSNSPQSATATWCVGDIIVNATLDGAPWTGAVNYFTWGPQIYSGNLVSLTRSNVLPGVWQVDYDSGGPANAVLVSVTPTASQTLPGNVASKPILTYTMNFATIPGSFSLGVPTTGCNGGISQINLSWTPSSGATSYTVHRSGGVPFTPVNVGMATSYTDSVIAAGTNYTYFIRATNANGTRDSNSNVKQAYWCAGDITINTTLDGVSWSAGSVNYTFTSSISSFSGTSPQTVYSNLPQGTWTLSYTSGGPAAATLTSITAANPQTIPGNVSSKPTLTYTMNFTSNAPTVDLDANASDGPISVTSGSTVTLSWTTGNTITSCTASNAWSGAKATSGGSETSGAITSNSTFTLSCTGPGGTTNDSVTVNVNPPGAFTLNAPSTSCVGASPRITLSWGSSLGATSYTVFRNSVSYAAGVTSPWTDTSVSSGTSYSYFVRASNASGTADSNTVNQAAYWCVGDITVNATLNSSAWAGSLNYDLLGPTNTNSTAVPTTHSNLQNGSWTLSYTSGGPAAATLTSITAANPQTIPGNVSSKPTLTYTMNFTSNAPTVDLDANASDGPISVTSGSTVTLSWTTGNTITSCTASNAWSGAKATSGGSETSGAITSNSTFTLSCTGPGGTAVDSVIVYVPPDPPPTLVADPNPCGTQVSLTWSDNSSDEDSFRIYRSSPGGSGSLGDYTLIDSNPANDNTYTDNPAAGGTTYSYAVTAFKILGGESSAAFSGVISNVDCTPQITASLSLIKVDGVACITPDTDCPSVRSGKTVTIRLTIGNSGNAPANNMSVTHTDIKNFNYSDGTAVCSACTNPPTPESGANPVTWNSSGPGFLGNKANDANNWNIDFDAVVTSTSLQPVDFFQDKTVIQWAGDSRTVLGGPWEMRTGTSQPPDFEEVAP